MTTACLPSSSLKPPNAERRMSNTSKPSKTVSGCIGNPDGRVNPVGSTTHQFPEELPGVALAHLSYFLRVPMASTRPPPLPPSGPKSITWSTDLTTSRLCSITTTVLPASTSRCKTWSSFLMSSK